MKRLLRTATARLAVAALVASNFAGPAFAQTGEPFICAMPVQEIELNPVGVAIAKASPQLGFLLNVEPGAVFDAIRESKSVPKLMDGLAVAPSLFEPNLPFQPALTGADSRSIWEIARDILGDMKRFQVIDDKLTWPEELDARPPPPPNCLRDGRAPIGVKFVEITDSRGRKIVPTAFQKQQVMLHARAWEPAMARFYFRFESDHCNAEQIKISFDETAGNKSKIGTRSSGPEKSSMNLIGINPQANPDKVRITIEHEFGHALGLLHETGHPDLKLTWDKPPVIAYFAACCNWSEPMVIDQVFTRYESFRYKCGDFDKSSVMVYPILAIWNAEKIAAAPVGITDGDVACIKKHYSVP